MICHNAIATDRPRIQQITPDAGEGPSTWRGSACSAIPQPSHVKFNHAPHIRAEVECATCHGDIAEQTVAQRNVELTMGVLRELPQPREGVERLPDLSLSTPMDRRSFIKLTPSPARPRRCASCGNPENAAHPLRARRGHRAGHGRVEAERLPAVRGRVRPDGPRDGRRRGRRARRPGRRRADLAAKKLEGAPAHPVNHGGLCARGQAAIQVTYHPDRITQPLKRTGERGDGAVRGDLLGRGHGELVAQLDALDVRQQRRRPAVLGRARDRGHRGAVDRAVPRALRRAGADRASSCSATTCCGAPTG